MRIAKALDLSAEMLQALYYALLLKDSGCSSNASRMAQLVGGDDRQAKAGARLTDWTSPWHADQRTLNTFRKLVLPQQGIWTKSVRLVRLGVNQQRNNEELVGLRCERGANILRKLGITDSAAEAVYHLDEHWDGQGYPGRLRGTAIPLLSRICSIAQTLDWFAGADGTTAAMAVLKKRCGRWFGPSLQEVVADLNTSGTLWVACSPGCVLEETRQAALQECPLPLQTLLPDQIDQVCGVFAAIIDAKSPFTFQHSHRVTEAAIALAREMRFSEERILLIRRAALLHDLGKLGVSNRILDKPSSLTLQERAVMAEHPKLTRIILERMEAFRDIARIAGEHHERLDGSGYPEGLVAGQLCLESRLLAVADSYATLAEDRPYRKALAKSKILSTLQALSPSRLDPDVVSALQYI